MKKLFWLLTAFLLVLPLRALAQQPTKISRIGFVSVPEAIGAPYKSFRRGLMDHGYIDGENIALEYRSVDPNRDRVTEATNILTELLRLKVELIVTGDPAIAHVAKSMTATVPILVVGGGDLLASGLVATLAHPGGNVTGFSTGTLSGIGKRLEILKEVVPKVSRVGVLWNPATNRAWKTEAQPAAQALGMQLQSLSVDTPDDLAPAFQSAIKQNAAALVVIRNPVTGNRRKEIAELALKNLLPVIYGESEFVEAGGLISYGTNVAELFRRSANYADKILKGTKPAELPVEQPTKFELVINLKTAKQIGLIIPPNVLARADRIIR